MIDTPWLAPGDAPRWVGIDVGGANLKGADGRGFSLSEPFELWKRPAELGAAIHAMLLRFGPHEGIALTMTGELADCYATKAAGVRAIVDATVEAAGATPVLIASVDDRWLTPAEGAESPSLVAAANWRVAARLVAEARSGGRGLWVDAGSTTIDAIPIRDGVVVSRGADDAGRLAAGELVYTGVRRTPVCALVDSLPYRGDLLPVAAEWFATTADVWLLLGELDADPGRCDTADGRPLVLEASSDRLARCFCLDREAFSVADARTAAEAIAAEQVGRIARAIAAADEPQPDWAIVSGEGAFLGRRALGMAWPDLRAEMLDSQAGANLPAHACAVLAAREVR